METLLLFCCQSCLKSDNDTEYYDRLNITSKATLDDIKKSYKKKSLQLHPDRLAQKGIQVTPEHNQEFQKLKEAYDVLSDPRKRRLYDKIGKSGLKLIDSPQEINPSELIRNFQQNKADRFKIILLILFIFASILILPILFSLKCDGKIDNVPWLALWTPMWVIDGVMIITAILFTIEKEEEPEDPDTPKHEKPEKIPLYIKLFFTARTFSFVLLQIFILMSLDQRVNWSWFAIFAPWFVYEFFALLDKLPSLITPIQPPDERELERQTAALDDEQEKIMIILAAQESYFKKLMERNLSKKSAIVSLLRVWLACFLAVQLDQTVNWDWGLVLLPIWCYFLLEIIHSYYLRQWGQLLLEGIDLEACERGEVTDPLILLKAQHGQELQAAGSMSTCSLPPIVFMGVLLISRLEASRFSTFIILIPIFGILGCCMCGILCGICAFSCLDTEGLSAEENKPVPTNSDDLEGQYQRKEELEAELSNLNNFEKSDASKSSSTSTPTPTPILVVSEPTTTNDTIKSNDDVESNHIAIEVTHIDADID